MARAVVNVGTRGRVAPQRSRKAIRRHKPKAKPLDQHTLMLPSFTSEGCKVSIVHCRGYPTELTRPLTMILLSLGGTEGAFWAPWPAALAALVFFFTPPTAAGFAAVRRFARPRAVRRDAWRLLAMLSSRDLSSIPEDMVTGLVVVWSWSGGWECIQVATEA
jgi:hypothetical protein